MLALTKSIRYPLVRAVPEALPAASPGLLLEGASPGRLLTLDLNHGLLAGTFLPADNQQIAFWSSGLSGADGVFEDPPGPGRTFWRCAARHLRNRRSPREPAIWYAQAQHSHESHKRLWSHNDEQDRQLQDHERRIGVLENRS